MTTKTAVSFPLLAATGLALAWGGRGGSAAEGTAAQPDSVMRADTAGHYADVNGLRMNYEIHGAGRPLVLLHGALSNTETDFGKVLPGLARTRQVIAIEQQGHGHTGDIDRPLNTAFMADDTAELLRQLKIDSADFLGYSMGAGIALQMALRHPELVRKLVLISPGYTPEGFYPEVLKGVENLQPEHLAEPPFQQAYARMAPNPEAWPALVAKVSQGSSVKQSAPVAALRAVTAPALIIAGDADVFRPEHMVELLRALLPGTTPSPQR